MARKRRQAEVFSLSFLDCICCGFGAVVLFYTVISAQSGIERVRRVEDLTGEVSKLEEQVLVGTKNLVVLRNTLQKTESDTTSAAQRAARLVVEAQQRRIQSSTFDQESLARRERIEQLKVDIKQLEESTQRLQAAAVDAAPAGQRIKAFRGTGNRRYITALRMKGKRIMVLVDTSASMLDDDLVNVIKLRNSSANAKRAARKWRRAIDIVEWLAAQLPDGSSYQVYGFDTRATAVLADTAGRWLPASDARQINNLLQALRGRAPADGTSLVNALAAAKAMKPAPDQIVLITDGLPTQGATAPAIRKYIDARERQKLFEDAIRGTPRGVPIDVVLLPMRGDSPAAHSFWRLARLTGGSYLVPSRDWP